MKERQRKKDGIQFVTQIPDKAFHSNDDGLSREKREIHRAKRPSKSSASCAFPSAPVYTYNTSLIHTPYSIYVTQKSHSHTRVQKLYSCYTQAQVQTRQKLKYLLIKRGENLRNIMYTFNHASTNPTKTEILADQERGKPSQYYVYKRNVFLTIMEFGRVEVRKICTHDCTIQVHLSPLRC